MSSLLVLFIPIALLIGVVVVLSLHFQKKRKLAIQQKAQELGYVYRAVPMAHVPTPILNFAAFPQSLRNGNIRHLIQKDHNGVEVSAMLYAFAAGKSVRYRTVVVIQDSALTLPHFRLQPKRVVQVVGEAFGRKGIHLPAHPTFSQNHYLTGKEQDHIRHYFHDGLVSFIHSQPEILLEGNGNCFICYFSQGLGFIDSFPHLVQIGLSIDQQLCLAENFER